MVSAACDPHDARVLGQLLAPAGREARLALLEVPEHWQAELAGMGCATVAVSVRAAAASDAAALERLKAFRATHVVLGEAASAHIERLLPLFARLSPEAELLVTRVNGCSVAVLLQAVLAQVPPAPSLSERDFEQLAGRSGYRVCGREALAARPRVGGLPVDVEQQLRQLLVAWNPAAASERFLAVLRPAPAEEVQVSTPLESELLSVVFAVGARGSEAQLDEALFALACQHSRPFELLLVPTAGGELRFEAARALAERYRRIRPYALHVLPASDLQAAVARARGRYLAFADATTLVYPHHFERMCEALEQGLHAWALARALRTEELPAVGSAYVVAKRPFPLGDSLDWVQLRRSPELLLAMVVDRQRLGTFALVQDAARGALPWELPVRLGAQCAPIFLAGLASCEVRDAAAPAVQGSLELEALPMLLSVGRFEQALEKARQEGASVRAFRHRLVDQLFERLHGRAPRLERSLKALAARVLQRGARRPLMDR